MDSFRCSKDVQDAYCCDMASCAPDYFYEIAKPVLQTIKTLSLACYLHIAIAKYVSTISACCGSLCAWELGG